MRYIVFIIFVCSCYDLNVRASLTGFRRKCSKKPIIVDISYKGLNENVTILLFDDSHIDRYHFLPKPGFGINMVVDGYVTVWDGGDTLCDRVVILVKDIDIIFVVIKFNTSFRKDEHYVRFREKYIRIPKKAFNMLWPVVEQYAKSSE